MTETINLSRAHYAGLLWFRQNSPMTMDIRMDADLDGKSVPSCTARMTLEKHGFIERNRDEHAPGSMLATYRITEAGKAYSMRHELVDNTLVALAQGVYANCTCGWSSGPRFSSMVASALFRDHLQQVGQPKLDELQGGRTAVFVRAFVPDNLVRPWLQHLRDFDALNPGCHFEIMADMNNIPIEVMVEFMRLNPGFSFQKIFDRNGDESLYDVAREICHKHGMDWTDPRTSKVWPAPKSDGDGA